MSLKQCNCREDLYKLASAHTTALRPCFAHGMLVIYILVAKLAMCPQDSIHFQKRLSPRKGDCLLIEASRARLMLHGQSSCWEEPLSAPMETQVYVSCLCIQSLSRELVEVENSSAVAMEQKRPELKTPQHFLVIYLVKSIHSNS